MATPKAASLTITMHPECIGRGHRMAMLETFIEQARALPGVEFERLDTVVARWSAADRPAESELRLNARSAQARAATSFARRRTASNIDGVSRPVNVFCWLGWYEPSRTYGPTPASARCPNRGFGLAGVADRRDRPRRGVPAELPQGDDDPDLGQETRARGPGTARTCRAPRPSAC